MKIQVLVAAMDQGDFSLPEKMNIQSDVIVGNQCSRNSVECFSFRGYQSVYLNFAERGVGLNRNNALLRAGGDICLLADEDLRYVDGYAQIVKEAFLAHPEADVLLFNVENSGVLPITRFHRVYFWNALRYGGPQMAFRLRSIRENGIFFNLCFGGGTEHQHGEDSLFLTDCLRKKLRVYAVPQTIGAVASAKSSWFRGYTDRYFADTGCLYRTMCPRFWKLLCLQHAFRHRRKYDVSFISAYRKMVERP